MKKKVISHLPPIKQLNLTSTCYAYNKGDASYHFLSSIHFSKGNISNKSKCFIVFRFQKANAKIKKNEVIKYENTRKEHLKIIK